MSIILLVLLVILKDCALFGDDEEELSMWDGGMDLAEGLCDFRLAYLDHGITLIRVCTTLYRGASVHVRHSFTIKYMM